MYSPTDPSILLVERSSLGTLTLLLNVSSHWPSRLLQCHWRKSIPKENMTGLLEEKICPVNVWGKTLSAQVCPNFKWNCPLYLGYIWSWDLEHFSKTMLKACFWGSCCWEVVDPVGDEWPQLVADVLLKRVAGAWHPPCSPLLPGYWVNSFLPPGSLGSNMLLCHRPKATGPADHGPSQLEPS